MAESYTFDYTAGEAADRFVIHFGALSTPEFDVSSVKIWSNEDVIYVQAPNINGEIIVVNMMGQEMARTDIDPGTNEIQMSEVNTYYIVKVLTSENAVTGKVYIPEETGKAPKKHSCQGCFACQWCDETRCNVCRDENAMPGGCPRISPTSTDDV